MSEPLTKSYVNTHDPEHPVQEDLVLYQLFEKARKEGNDGELLSLEDMGRMTASQVYDKVTASLTRDTNYMFLIKNELHFLLILQAYILE